MNRPKLAKEKLILSFFLVCLLLGGVVYATVVGPNGISGSGFFNGTLINVDQIFIDSVNYTASVIAGGGAGWDGTGALFQNGTRGLTADWDAGAWTINAENISAADYTLDSVGNLTAYIDAGDAGNGWDGTGALFQNGTRGLTADWDAGAWTINAENISAADYTLDSVGNYTAWIEAQISAGSAGGNGTQPDDFTIIFDGTNYLAINETGGVEYSNADAYTTIQEAINHTTQRSGVEVYHLAARDKGQASVKLGPWDFDIGANTILLPNHIHFYGSGEPATIISQSSGNLIEPMWANYTFDVWVSDMRTEGGSRLISWDCTDSTIPGGDTYSYWFKLTDFQARSGSGDEIYIETSTGSGNTIVLFDTLRVSGSISINRVFDAIFNNVFCYTTDWDRVSTSHFSNWYIGGAGNPNIWIHGGTSGFPVHGNVYTNIRSDNPAGEALLIDGYIRDESWSNSQFTNKDEGTGDNDQSAIHISTANAHHISFTGCWIGNYLDRTTDTFDYLVQIDAGAHNISVMNNQYEFSAFSYGTDWILFDDADQVGWGYSNYYMFGTGSTAVASDNHYLAPMAIYSTNANLIQRTSIIPADGYIMNLAVELNTAPGAASDYRSIFFNIEGSDEAALNVTLNQAETIGRDDSGYIAVSRGDRISLHHTFVDSPTASFIYGSWTFVAKYPGGLDIP